MSKKKDKTKPITSQLELATRCGVSRNALAKHFRREVFPVSRQGPWDEHHVDMIRAYLDALPGNNQGGDQRDEKDKVDIRLKLERVAKLKREREILEELYVLREDVEIWFTSRANYFRASLEAGPERLSERLVGRDAWRIAEILREWVESVLADYTREPRPGVKHRDGPASHRAGLATGDMA